MKEVIFMPEEFKPGCQRPSIKKTIEKPAEGNEVNAKKVNGCCYVFILETLLLSELLKFQQLLKSMKSLKT